MPCTSLRKTFEIGNRLFKIQNVEQINYFKYINVEMNNTQNYGPTHFWINIGNGDDVLKGQTKNLF